MTKAFYVLTIFLSMISMPLQANTLPPKLKSTFKTIQERTHIGAVSYALVEGDKVIAVGGMGQKSLEDKTPVTADSLIRIGSITKTFTAIAMMKLVEQGKLTLDSPVKTLLPDIPFKNPYPNSPATLAMMLEHTSGLTDLTGKEFNYPAALSLEDAFKVAPEARVARWQPGYHKSYTNAGAGYISAAVEKVTQQNYDTWFNNTVLKPMGMTNSQLHWSPEVQDQLIAGYDADLKTRLPYWHTLFRAFGNLNTTARDMSRFLLFMVNQGMLDKEAFLSASSLDRMESPQTTLAAQQGLSLGYGLGVRSQLFKGHRIYQHGGDADGYISHFGYNKESKRGYLVVINAYKHSILRQYTAALKQWLIEDLNQPEPPAIQTLSTAHLQQFIGTYQPTAYRFAPRKDASINIQIKDGQLVRSSQNGGRERPLLAVSKWLFRYKNDTEATLAFIRAPDGHLYLQNGDFSLKKVESLALTD